jgi:hypothetical protein
VPKVLAAAAAAFASIGPAGLQWDIVHALHALPQGCAELEACQSLFVAAGQKLQQELGDLELVWADEDKQQLLLSLPQPALLQLLRDPETRVSSENTVFCTVRRWCNFRKDAGSQPAPAVLTGLAEALRMKVSY